MPIIPLDPDIVSDPSRLHLAEIGSWMLWPHDQTKRLELHKAAVVETGRDSMRREQLHPALLEMLLDLRAKPLDEVTRQLTPHEHGLMAGTILIAALQGKDSNGGRLSRGEIDARLRKSFAPQRGGNSKLVNTIWTNYRSVSHLWAAHIKYTEHMKAETGSDCSAFPCEARDLVTFLWLSEEWRKRGESTKTAPSAPTTILRSGECVRVPEVMRFSN
jgi:hypothetical protein